MKNEHHVVPHHSGGWDIKRNGSIRASKHCDTKEEAIHRGRTMSRNAKSELVIHDKGGKIMAKDSHGHDPRSSKG